MAKPAPTVESLLSDYIKAKDSVKPLTEVKMQAIAAEKKALDKVLEIRTYLIRLLEQDS